jgi:hypothetical protein
MTGGHLAVADLHRIRLTHSAPFQVVAAGVSAFAQQGVQGCSAALAWNVSKCEVVVGCIWLMIQRPRAHFRRLHSLYVS